MKLAHMRPYRVLRVAATVVPVLLSYATLFLRARLGRPATSERWDAVHLHTAQRIERLALALGGIFIKLAQVLGARRDVFPTPFITVLSKFHDQVPPRPFSQIVQSIEADLNAPLATHFAYVDPTPLAAASLAQVHKATLTDGHGVVVKVQYPEVQRLFPTDIKSARLVARIVQRFPIHIDFVALVDEIAKGIALELDFPREIVSTRRVAAAFANHPDVCIPEIIDSASSERTITLLFLDGIQVTHTDALQAAGHDLEQVAQRIARLYVTMIFQHGFFHGDPHPGNLLVLKDGRIGLLDFGLAKELPPGFGNQVAHILLSTMQNDLETAVAAAEKIGFRFGGNTAAGLRHLITKLMGMAQGDADVSLFTALAESPVKQIPADFPLIVRAFILLNGLSEALAPGKQIIQRTILAELQTIATTTPQA